MEQHLSVCNEESPRYDPYVNKDLCNSVVFLARGNNKSKKALSDAEAKETLLELCDSEKRKAYQKILEQFQHVNFAWIKDLGDQDLHTKNGILLVEPLKQISLQIKKAVDTLVDDSEIFAKTMKDGTKLTLGTMCDFLSKAVRKVPSSMVNAIISDEKSQSCYPTNNDTNLEKYCHPDGNHSADRRKPPVPPKPVSSKQVSKLCNHGQNNHYLSTSDDGNPRNDFGLRNEVSQLSSTGNAMPCRENAEMAMEIDEASPVVTVTSATTSVVNVEVGNYQIETEVEQLEQVFKELDIKDDSHHENKMATSFQETNIDDAIYQAQKQEKEAQSLQTGNSAAQAVTGNMTLQPQLGMALVKVKEQENAMETATSGLPGKDLAYDKKARVIEIETETERLDVVPSKPPEQERKTAEKSETERQKKCEDDAAAQAEYEMESGVLVAASELKQNFHLKISKWINQELTLANANQLEIIYVNELEKVMKKFQPVIHTKLQATFVTKVNGLCKPDMMKLLKRVAEPVMNIRNAIKKQFGYHGYFTKEKLEEIAWAEFKKATSEMTEELPLRLVRKATEKILNIYQEQNEKIVVAELQLYHDAKKLFVPFYKDQMTRYINANIYSTERLSRIHGKLFLKLAGAFKTACGMDNSPMERLQEELASLEADLKRELYFFKNKNDEKLQNLERETKKIIQNMKIRYTETIEGFLSSNPDGLENKILKQRNDEIVNEVLKLLEMEIRQKVRKDEPLESHKHVFLTHAQAYLPEVLKANQQNLEKARVRREAEQKSQVDAKRKQEQAEKVSNASCAQIKTKSPIYQEKLGPSLTS